MSYGLQPPSGWWGNSGTYDVGAPGDETTAGQTAGNSTSNDGWADWWKGIGQTVVNYAIAKDAAGSGLAQQHSGGTMPGGYTGPAYAPRQEPLGGLLPLLIVGGIIYAVAK